MPGINLDDMIVDAYVLALSEAKERRGLADAAARNYAYAVVAHVVSKATGKVITPEMVVETVIARWQKGSQA